MEEKQEEVPPGWPKPRNSAPTGPTLLPTQQEGPPESVGVLKSAVVVHGQTQESQSSDHNVPSGQTTGVIAAPRRSYRLGVWEKVPCA